MTKVDTKYCATSSVKMGSNEKKNRVLFYIDIATSYCIKMGGHNWPRKRRSATNTIDGACERKKNVNRRKPKTQEKKIEGEMYNHADLHAAATVVAVVIVAAAAVAVAAAAG